MTIVFCYTMVLAIPVHHFQSRSKHLPRTKFQVLNIFLWVQHFSMESSSPVIISLQPEDILASVDNKNAYLHVPIFLAHQFCLHFTAGMQHYQFIALPFGLPNVPQIFTKVLAPVLALLCTQGISIV